jgi:hypothetical protein
MAERSWARWSPAGGFSRCCKLGDVARSHQDLVLTLGGSSMEPYRLRRWRPSSSSQDVKFFTCARPGRSKGASGRVPDALVDKWVRGLPNQTKTIIISLLGYKPDGKSEFSFYSFHGGWDLPASHGLLSFQEWFDRSHKERSIQVIEHPTHDFRPIPQGTLQAIESDISRLLSEGRTIVVMDSGGETRTTQVCKHMRFIEDTRTV